MHSRAAELRKFVVPEIIFGAPGEIRQRLVAEIRRLREALGIRDTLSQRGLHRTDVRGLAVTALDDPCIVTNPRRPNLRDIETLYEECL